MKAKILILVSLLYSVATWGQLKPEEAKKLRIQNVGFCWFILACNLLFSGNAFNFYE